MFKTIMWATDGTENADRALPYAKALAQEEGATLVVAHVVERYASHKASGLAVHADEEQVEAKLKKLAAQLSDEGQHAEAIIALNEDTGEGLGVARYVRSPERPDVAEVAVTVIDDWQARAWHAVARGPERSGTRGGHQQLHRADAGHR
jgi:nucleotide-binding universal stress UspA family protein